MIAEKRTGHNAQQNRHDPQMKRNRPKETHSSQKPKKPDRKQQTQNQSPPALQKWNLNQKHDKASHIALKKLYIKAK